MSRAFPFIAIPDEALPVIGRPREGTRVYETEGSENQVAEWFEAVSEIAGNTVSPGGVSMFAPVTRAAVHKRLSEGRLTAFAFAVEESRRGLFGRKKSVRTLPYVYIPVSECKAWRKEIEKQMLRLGKVSKEELEGERPDWSNDFWKRQSRQKGTEDRRK